MSDKTKYPEIEVTNESTLAYEAGRQILELKHQLAVAVAALGMIANDDLDRPVDHYTRLFAAKVLKQIGADRWPLKEIKSVRVK